MTVRHWAWCKKCHKQREVTEVYYDESKIAVTLECGHEFYPMVEVANASLTGESKAMTNGVFIYCLDALNEIIDDIRRETTDPGMILNTLDGIAVTLFTEAGYGFRSEGNYNAPEPWQKWIVTKDE